MKKVKREGKRRMKEDDEDEVGRKEIRVLLYSDKVLKPLLHNPSEGK